QQMLGNLRSRLRHELMLALQAGQRAELLRNIRQVFVAGKLFDQRILGQRSQPADFITELGYPGPQLLLRFLELSDPCPGRIRFLACCGNGTSFENADGDLVQLILEQSLTGFNIPRNLFTHRCTLTLAFLKISFYCGGRPVPETPVRPSSTRPDAPAPSMISPDQIVIAGYAMTHWRAG